MMNEKEIIDFLLKENIGEQDKNKFLNEIANTPKLDELFKIVESITKIDEYNHIELDVLSEYILNLNGDKINETKFVFLAPKIEKHLKNCSLCKEEFELLNSELHEVDTFLSEKIISNENVQEDHTKKKSIISWIYTSQIKYAFASAASITILFMFLFTISEITTPENVKISSSITNVDFSNTRGRTSEYFTKAIDALENKNYKDAIVQLEKDISNSKNDLTVFYSHYILGISHLTNAHTDYLGLFNNFSLHELEKAQKNFAKVLELNNSGMFEHINYNSDYFLGQIFLLKGEHVKALEYLTKAINNKSEYSDQANELLRTME